MYKWNMEFKKLQNIPRNRMHQKLMGIFFNFLIVNGWLDSKF